MRFLHLSLAVAFAAAAHAYAATQSKEDYVRAPLPPGFQVVMTELEGPVFADARGHTLYKWPLKSHRNGDAGEIENKPTCDDHVYRENAGIMTPYPGGLELPELDTRPSCTAVWPPVLAAEDAKPVGRWSVVVRPDGRKQWTYDQFALYTSALDQKAGDVLGGSNALILPESGSIRLPVGPDPNVPPQFSVHTTMLGRLVETREGWSIYSYDGDGRNKSNCADACLDGWAPVLAADYAHPVGEWTLFERAPGIRQWAFRSKPVYRHLNDRKLGALDGGDVARWHNLYTQMAPVPPGVFVMKETRVGLVLGDARGRTLYRYVCTDDALDQLACDHPDSPQAYRWAVCGGGDVERCFQVFPYVVAPANARSGSGVWGTAYVDPKTGKWAGARDANALHVWTFRGRPIYTFAGINGYGDEKPGDLKAHAWGEFNGQRNGYHAMVYRDLYSSRDE